MTRYTRMRTAFIFAATAAIVGTASAQEAEVRELPDLEPIKTRLVELRGLEFKRDVPSKVQPTEEFGKMVRAELDLMFPADRREGIVNGLLRLGLLQTAVDFGDAFTNALMTQAAAYYDPESGTFYYLAMDLPAMAIRTVAAHELVHALQDQHYDLKKLQNNLEAMAVTLPRDDDRMLAARYLVEGEATYVQMLFQTPMLVDNPQMQDMTISSMAQLDIDAMIKMAETQLAQTDADGAMADAMRAMKDIPAYILHPLNAAYTQGAYFVMRARQAAGDGWDGVAAVYDDMPESTEQVMHPERYVRNRDRRTLITLPEMAALRSAGASLVDSAIHGEFYLRLLLQLNGVEKPTAARAAAGWDGDVYAAYSDDSGQTSIVLATTWDTEADAREFFEAYVTLTDTKYADKSNVAGSIADGRVAFDCGDGLGAGFVALRGREVFAVEGSSQVIAAMTMMELLSMTIEHVD